MRKITYLLALAFISITMQAQTNVEEIKEIQSYIQKTSQTEWFDPLNEKGTTPTNATFDLAYYLLPNGDVFSIIYSVFDKTTLRKTFYYKNNELIACIVEEFDSNNANKLIQFADYFIKDNTLINKENKNFASTEIIAEGLQKLQEKNN